MIKAQYTHKKRVKDYYVLAKKTSIMGLVSDIKPPNKKQKVLDCSRVLPRRAVGAGGRHPAHQITTDPLPPGF